MVEPALDEADHLPRPTLLPVRDRDHERSPAGVIHEAHVGTLHPGHESREADLQHDLFACDGLHVLDEMTPELPARAVEVFANEERQLRERAAIEEGSVLGRNHVSPEVPVPT